MQGRRTATFPPNLNPGNNFKATCWVVVVQTVDFYHHQKSLHWIVAHRCNTFLHSSSLVFEGQVKVTTKRNDIPHCCVRVCLSAMKWADHITRNGWIVHQRSHVKYHGYFWSELLPTKALEKRFQCGHQVYILLQSRFSVEIESNLSSTEFLQQYNYKLSSTAFAWPYKLVGFLLETGLAPATHRLILCVVSLGNSHRLLRHKPFNFIIQIWPLNITNRTPMTPS